MDLVYTSWLEQQQYEGMALAAASDVLTLTAEPGAEPPRRYLAHYDSPSMTQVGNEIQPVRGFAVMFQFPREYLRQAPNAGQIVHLLSPELYHPNVQYPFICVGRIAPGTALVELIFRVYEILTFMRVTMNEYDALNRDACAWARRHTDSFPLTTAPLKRRAAPFTVDEIASSAHAR